MIKEFAAAAMRRIDEAAATRMAQVAKGSCKSFEDYKETCGQIRGLELARQLIEDTLKNVEEDEDV